MGWKNRLLRAYSYWPYRNFLRAMHSPQVVEDANWLRYLALYRAGSFWKSFAPKALESGQLSAFDISDYEDYRSAIQDSKQNGINPLSGERVAFYADSAGTTALPKEFPITESFRKDYQKTQAPMVHRFTTEFPKFLDSPALYITATDSPKKAPCGVEIGYISNFNYRNMPKMIASFYGIPKEALKDESAFNTWAPVYAVAHNISAIFAITPRVMCNFFANIVDHRAQILEKLRKPDQVPEGFPRIPVSRARLEWLEILFAKPSLAITDLWSNLSFVCTWKASLAGMQLSELQRWLPQTPILDGTYSATEAWFNVPWFRQDLGGPLCHGGSIVEFIPDGMEIKKENLLRSWQLQKGQDYEVFVTTSMGMVRYRMKDIVHCSGFLEKSPILYFKYKAENLISLTTLRISEDQIARAFAGLGVEDTAHLRVAPASDGAGLLVVQAEGNRYRFSAQDFDKALSAVNPYYEEETESGHVGRSQVLTLPRDHKIFAHLLHAQSKPKLVSKMPIQI